MKRILPALLLILLLLLPSCKNGDETGAEAAGSFRPGFYDLSADEAASVTEAIALAQKAEKRTYESNTIPNYDMRLGEGWNQTAVCYVGDELSLRASALGTGDIQDYDIECLSQSSSQCVSVISDPGTPPLGEWQPVLTVKADAPGVAIVSYIVRDHTNQAEIQMHYPIIVLE